MVRVVQAKVGLEATMFEVGRAKLSDMTFDTHPNWWLAMCQYILFSCAQTLRGREVCGGNLNR